MEQFLQIAQMHALQHKTEKQPHECRGLFTAFDTAKNEHLSALRTLSTVFTEYAIARDSESHTICPEIAIGIGLAFQSLTASLTRALDGLERLDAVLSKQIYQEGKQDAQGANNG